MAVGRYPAWGYSCPRYRARFRKSWGCSISSKEGCNVAWFNYEIYWFLVGNTGNLLYRGYIGIIFPCSLLSTGKEKKLLSGAAGLARRCKPWRGRSAAPLGFRVQGLGFRVCEGNVGNDRIPLMGFPSMRSGLLVGRSRA